MNRYSVCIGIPCVNNSTSVNGLKADNVDFSHDDNVDCPINLLCSHRLPHIRERKENEMNWVEIILTGARGYGEYFSSQIQYIYSNEFDLLIRLFTKTKFLLIFSDFLFEILVRPQTLLYGSDRIGPCFASDWLSSQLFGAFFEDTNFYYARRWPFAI